jgi:long-subunit acyl-CoA synthetase (AMP-forming)
LNAHRFFEADDKGVGEVCMWGRNVMMGYLNREDKTTEDIDKEGWFHSGDLGFQDEDGFLRITGKFLLYRVCQGSYIKILNP